ncbi:protein of unknown function [Pararobbsia alpina]
MIRITPCCREHFRPEQINLDLARSVNFDVVGPSLQTTSAWSPTIHRQRMRSQRAPKQYVL